MDPLTLLPRPSIAVASLLALAALSTSGCGGAKTEAQTGGEAPAAKDESEGEMSEEEAALLDQIEASAADADAAAGISNEAAEPSDEERETVYRVSPDGMKVQIAGAEFIPEAEAVRVNGGWGLKLTVTATTTQELILFSPENGPLAFGGTVTRGEVTQFGDKRSGGIEQKLSPGAPLTFSRTWPPAGEKGLARGEELLLMVGLWGLGTETANRRPVNKFVVVKMVADSQGARPVMQPPH
jgi:hypothetical protein